MNRTCVFLALGSNIGNRAEHLDTAISVLQSNPDIAILQESPVYETAPKYNSNQPDFFNMVIEIDTTLEPLQLLNFCKDTERSLGRNISTIRNAPREIDIDIIFYGRLIIELPTLRIPHPGLYERRFVLAPLAEIAPEFTCPKTGKSVVELLAICVDPDRISRRGRLHAILNSPVSIGAL